MRSISKDEKHTENVDFCMEDKQIRDSLNEAQIDKMIMDSFPASDSPSTY